MMTLQEVMMYMYLICGLIILATCILAWVCMG